LHLKKLSHPRGDYLGYFRWAPLILSLSLLKKWQPNDWEKSIKGQIAFGSKYVKGHFIGGLFSWAK